MSKKSTILLGLLAAAILLSISGCGRETRIVGITVQPTGATFPISTPGAEVHYTALGTFIHPPGTRDISNEVTWKADAPQVVDLNGGVVTTNGSCGITNIYASTNKDTGSSENIVIGFATVTVNDPGNPLCPGGSATKAVLTIAFAGNGTGTVISSPAGINCPTGACAAQFTKGDPIALTATAASGSTFGGWTNCPSPSGNTCTVTLDVNESVTATFN